MIHGSTMRRRGACGGLCATPIFAAMIFPAMARFRFLLAASLALGIAAPAHAQFWGAPLAPAQAPPVRPAPAKPAAPAVPAEPAGPPPPPVQDQPAPYDPDLERLSEILGALHFLRGICNSNDGQKWRNEAQALIDAEAPTGDRHDEMVASFNRGYRGFQESYRACTPAADVVIHRYMQEGAKIARDITARYAN
jgi:uncharacterized protein (TIGR02301 family)